MARYVLLSLAFALSFRQARADELDRFDTLVKYLTHENAKSRAEAQRKLAAMRSTDLSRIVAELETAKDPETQRQLLAVLAPNDLAPKASTRLLDTFGIPVAMAPTLDAYLEKDAEAEKKLLKMAPHAALGVQLRLEAEKDTAKRIRLRLAYYRLLYTSPERANAVLEAAKGLHTLGSNHGPYKATWQSREVARLRARGKLLHWCFVNPQHYGPALQKNFRRNLGMFMPHRDLPAARDLYLLAQRMYTRLADAEKDKEKSARLREQALTAGAGAAQCGAGARRVK